MRLNLKNSSHRVRISPFSLINISIIIVISCEINKIQNLFVQFGEFCLHTSGHVASDTLHKITCIDRCNGRQRSWKRKLPRQHESFSAANAFPRDAVAAKWRRSESRSWCRTPSIASPRRGYFWRTARRVESHSGGMQISLGSVLTLG